MVKQIEEYPYSSYHEYLSGKTDITELNFSLDVINSDRKKAILQFAEFHEAIEREAFEIETSPKLDPQHIRRIIISAIDGSEPASIKSMDKESRNKIVKMLINEKHISKRALERATGISRGTIIRLCAEKS